MSHPFTTNNSIPRELNRVFLSPFSRSLPHSQFLSSAHTPIEWQMLQRYEWMSFHFEFTSPSHYHRLHKTIWKVSLPHPVSTHCFGAFDLFSLCHFTGKAFSSKQWLIHKIFVPAVDVCGARCAVCVCALRCISQSFVAFCHFIWNIETIQFPMKGQKAEHTRGVTGGNRERDRERESLKINKSVRLQGKNVNTFAVNQSNQRRNKYRWNPCL